MADYDVTNLKAAANLLAEMKVSTKGIANDQGRSNDLERELIAINKEMLDTKGKIKGEFKAFVSIVDDANLKIKAQVDLYEDEYDLAKSQLKITQASYKKLVESKDVTEKQKEAGNQYFQTQIDQFKVLVKEQKLRSDLKAKADGMLDGLESQVKKIPIVGDMLASTLDFGGLKKEMGGILSGITANFTMLKAGGMGTGKAIGKSFMKAIPQVASFGATLWAAIVPLLPIILPIIAAMYLLKKAFEFSSQVTELARDLGVSNDEAREMSHSFNQMAADSGELSVNSADLLKAQKELSTEFGRSAQFSEQMLTDQVKLTKFMGMSGKEAADFAKMAGASGMETRELQQEIAGMTSSYNELTGDSINFKDINKEIIGLTKQQRSQFKGNHKEMILTVIEAKALGTTIEDINKAADATLDIESSLRNEAIARMKTGVSINNNEIRAAQLSGNTAKVLELQKKQVMEIGDFENMRPDQQDAIALAMGKSSEEVLKQREAMKIMEKLGVKSLDGLTKEQLIHAGVNAEKAEQMILDAEKLSAQEKMDASMSKIMDTVMKMAGPLLDLLDPFMEIVDFLIPAIGPLLKFAFAPIMLVADIVGGIIKMFKGDLMGGLHDIFGGIIEFFYKPFFLVVDLLTGFFPSLGKMVENALKYVKDLAADILPDWAVKLIFGTDDKGNVAGTDAPAPTEKIDDGIVKPDGTVVKTNPSDFIMAMLNPMDMFDGIGDTVGGLMSSVTSGLGGGGAPVIDYEKLAAAMSTRPIVLNIDGKSVSAISKVQTKQASFRK
jgi:hypothetical protein